MRNSIQIVLFVSRNDRRDWCIANGALGQINSIAENSLTLSIGQRMVKLFKICVLTYVPKLGKELVRYQCSLSIVEFYENL